MTTTPSPRTHELPIYRTAPAPAEYAQFLKDFPHLAKPSGGLAAAVHDFRPGMLRGLALAKSEVDRGFRWVEQSDRAWGRRAFVGSLAALLGMAATAFGYGDCDTAVRMYMEAAMAQGVPRNNLRMLICRTSQGRGHMVLVCRLAAWDGRGYVLDNLQPRVLLTGQWLAAGYRPLIMEGMPGSPRWLDLRKPRTLADLWKT